MANYEGTVISCRSDKILPPLNRTAFENIPTVPYGLQLPWWAFVVGLLTLLCISISVSYKCFVKTWLTWCKQKTYFAYYERRSQVGERAIYYEESVEDMGAMSTSLAEGSSSLGGRGGEGGGQPGGTNNSCSSSSYKLATQPGSVTFDRANKVFEFGEAGPPLYLTDDNLFNEYGPRPPPKVGYFNPGVHEISRKQLFKAELPKHLPPV